jgi:hypothetical protein
MAGKAGPGLGWKLFAGWMVLMVLIGDVPKLLHPEKLAATWFLLLALHLAALAGLVAYAFGQRLFSARFWRLFGPLFCLVTAGQFGAVAPVLAALLYLTQGSLAGAAGLLLAVVPVIAMAVFTCIALLRQAELLGPDRRPFGARPAQLSLPLA